MSVQLLRGEFIEEAAWALQDMEAFPTGDITQLVPGSWVLGDVSFGNTVFLPRQQ